MHRVEAVGNTRQALISEAGCLPCPHFQHGNCSCHAFSMQTFCQHLSKEAFREWQAAVHRMAVAEALNDWNTRTLESLKMEMTF